MNPSSKLSESWEIPIEIHTFDVVSIMVPEIMWFMSRLQYSSTTFKLRKSILDGYVIVVSDGSIFLLFQ